jgi:hypothetical protein
MPASSGSVATPAGRRHAPRSGARRHAVESRHEEHRGDAATQAQPQQHEDRGGDGGGVQQADQPPFGTPGGSFARCTSLRVRQTPAESRRVAGARETLDASEPYVRDNRSGSARTRQPSPGE